VEPAGQVPRRQIDCQWSRPGKYHAAVSPKGSRELLEPFASELDQLGEPYRWLDREELAREIGTAYNHAAIHTPGCVLLQPAALTHGLAATFPENVSLYENTPVTGATYENGVRLTTPGGSIFATNMILAANGFAEQFGFFRGRLLHLAAYASISRPLTPAEREALGGLDNWGVTPANTFAGVTMRFTPDQRILIRQRIVHGPDMRRSEAGRAAAREGHVRILRDRFPMLPGLDLEYTWSGMLCLSSNQGHGFGRIGPNVYGASCHNALGLTKGTISGILAADLAAGQDNPLIADMEALGKPSWLPPRPFLDIGVQARLAWELWNARAER
jgi:glycine/D-amino acid oxidase-like deaminating enzyme